MDDLRALQSDTYYGLLKTMQVRDWHFRSLLERETVVATIRRELCISDDQHYNFLTRLEHDASVARMKAAVGNGEATAPGVKRPRPEGVAKAAGGPAKRPATGKAGGFKPAKAAAPAGVQYIEQPVDGLLGRRIKRYWPEEGGWFEAVITNYNPENGEHCMMYDMGTPNETYAWERLSEVKKEEIVWVQGPLVPLSQIVEPLPLAQAPVVRPPVGGAARGGAQGRKAQTAGMPAVARDLENAVQRAKDVSKLDEVQLQVEARMRELQQKLAALEDSGPAVAAPAPQQLPPPQQQHVAEEAPVAEAAGAPAEGDEHETSVSGEDA